MKAPAPLPVLKHSDVIFMYESDRQTYEAYGATVLAWGGTPKPQSMEQAKGLRWFGSVGMVTEFNRYYDRFPDSYEQGLCRDLEGKPFKVPWLTDHQHKGVPYWWCCTRQPLFRQYISERVIQTVRAGADGVHIDDHLGSAGALWLGACFCPLCVTEFRPFLKGRGDGAGLKEAGNLEQFDFRSALRAWLADHPGQKMQQHPLWENWRTYQLRGAAEFMQELRALAARTAGHSVPLSANACLLWGPHLNDYLALDLFSAEIEHHASGKQFTDAPLLAYRLADAVGRPLASTASGGDWAFIKEHNLPGLVEGWIVLGYAAGHSLMAPNHQWCYTPEKGTHWYDGPRNRFAPLYQFVRQHPQLFDGFETFGDLTVAFSQRTFDRDQARITAPCGELAKRNISYRVAFGGDEVVTHPLPADELRQSKSLLILGREDFSPEDRALLASVPKQGCAEDLAGLLPRVSPAVQVEATSEIRAFPRVKPGVAVVHLVNWSYSPEKDGVRPIDGVTVHLDLQALGVAKATEARVWAPGSPEKTLPIQLATVQLDQLGLWTVIEIRSAAK